MKRVSLSIGMVACLAAVLALGWLRIGRVLADCDHDCGTPNGLCEGTDTPGCDGTCQLGQCNEVSGGKTWTNVVTRGATTGGKTVASTSVTCFYDIPCVNVTPLRANHTCEAGIPPRCSWMPFSNCRECADGPKEGATVQTCYVVDPCNPGS